MLNLPDDLHLKNVLRIVVDAMPLQKGNIFHFESRLSMVLSLFANVILDNVRHGLANGKGAVAALPFESAGEFSLLVNPSRRIGFEQLKGL